MESGAHHQIWQTKQCIRHAHGAPDHFAGWGAGGGPPGGMFNHSLAMNGGFGANMMLQSHLMQVRSCRSCLETVQPYTCMQTLHNHKHSLISLDIRQQPFKCCRGLVECHLWATCKVRAVQAA